MVASKRTTRHTPPAVDPGSADPPENLGPVLEFMQLLWGVQHGLESRSKRMEAASGVTAPQRMVLRILGKKPRLAAGNVARLLRVHPSTLTGVLRRLEERGLVEREVDVADKRRALFSLTEAGMLTNRTRARTVESSVKKALERLEEPEVRAAATVLQILADELARKD